MVVDAVAGGGGSHFCQNRGAETVRQDRDIAAERDFDLVRDAWTYRRQGRMGMELGDSGSSGIFLFKRVWLDRQFHQKRGWLFGWIHVKIGQTVGGAAIDGADSVSDIFGGGRRSSNGIQMVSQIRQYDHAQHLVYVCAFLCVCYMVFVIQMATRGGGRY